MWKTRRRRSCLEVFTQEIHQITESATDLNPGLLEDLTEQQRHRMVDVWLEISIAERSSLLIGMLEKLGHVQKEHPSDQMWLSPNFGQILFALLMDCECEEKAEDIDHMDVAIHFALEAFTGRTGPIHDRLSDEQRSSITEETKIADINTIAMTDLMLAMLMLIRAGYGPRDSGGSHRRSQHTAKDERSVVARLFGRLLPTPQTTPA